MAERVYIAIDLKSFYASAECVMRELDPLTTNLVVADSARTNKTICLAVSPSLKAYGIPGRPRLFEVERKVREINARRLVRAPGGAFTGSSVDAEELAASDALSLDYITAVPRMAKYVEYSTRIYNIYLQYVAPEDIHVYSIDEVFMDVTDYLGPCGKSAREFADAVIHDILQETKITATAGIGTNLYLSKVAMDIVAKHIEPDKDGVRIAELDEMSYRRLLWGHRPLTDFWRVGRGYARKLEQNGLFTMGDIARCSLGNAGEYYNEELLYRLFGVNAELLIDHAWGWEPCTMQDIKSFKPKASSIGSGQVLQCPYSFEKARLIVREMADSLALDLVEKEAVADQIILTVGYDRENISGSESGYQGEVVLDHYGRRIPKHAHGTVNLGGYTSSSRRIRKAVSDLYDRIVDPGLSVRRITISAGHVTDRKSAAADSYEQMSLFADDSEQEQRREEEEREERMQRAMLSIREKYGKNAVMKGMDLEEGATAADRNRQIGGHRA